MKRLSNTVTQKHLRTLAIKHGMRDIKAGEKVESPLMKVDSNGNLSCVICRTPLKSASIWKVHVNSKAHKNNVEAAKNLKSKILNTKNINPPISKNVPTEIEVPKNIKLSSNEESSKKKIQELDASKNAQTTKNVTHDPLPETFFDSSAKDVKAKHDNNDAEWELFQKEIKEVSEAPNEIFADDQKDLAVQKEIEEIDEQIQHWSKVLDLEEKRKNLTTKMIGNVKSMQQCNQSGDESSEGEDFEEYADWRSKEFK